MIRRCPVAEILASKALIAEYAAECSIPAIGEINPQAETYALMENAGIAQSFMASEGGFDVGLAIALTPVLPHYGKMVASVESLFVAGAFRRGGPGLDLMRTMEKSVAGVGSVGILYSALEGSDLERLLNASKHYQRTHSVFYRSLV